MNISTGVRNSDLLYYGQMKHEFKVEYIYVSVRPGGELDPTCIVEKCRSYTGWMFWACFNGITKGPCVFWENNWGHIIMESYIKHIIPVLDNWLQQHPGFQFIQDRAPGHTQ